MQPPVADGEAEWGLWGWDGDKIDKNTLVCFVYSKMHSVTSIRPRAAPEGCAEDESASAADEEAGQ